MASTTIYTSVGQAGDRKTGSPTITIASGVATLSVAQTGNIGIGCVIDYDSDNKKARINSVISATEFGVHVETTPFGAPADIGPVAVNSIETAHSTLGNACHTLAGGNGVSSEFGLTHSSGTPLDLVTLDLEIVVALYTDIADATTQGQIDVRYLTADATHRWVHKTPRTAAECILSNYPDGSRGSGYVVAKQVQPRDASHVVFEGLEIHGGVNAFSVTGATDCTWIACRAYNVTGDGFLVCDGGLHLNCIAESCGDTGFITGRSTSFSTLPRFYGCLAYGCDDGFIGGSNAGILNGCMAFGCTTQDFASNAGSSGSDDNASSDGTASAISDANSVTGASSYASYFTDHANGDFTLVETTDDGGVFGGSGIQADGPSSDSNVLDYDALGFARSGAAIDAGPYEYDDGGDPPDPPDPPSGTPSLARSFSRGFESAISRGIDG